MINIDNINTMPSRIINKNNTKKNFMWKADKKAQSKYNKKKCINTLMCINMTRDQYDFSSEEEAIDSDVDCENIIDDIDNYVRSERRVSNTESAEDVDEPIITIQNTSLIVVIDSDIQWILHSSSDQLTYLANDISNILTR
jgi:hypothetical protein